MRFVSVVVPLWLTAIASVSLMSSCSPNPDSSVAIVASTATRAIEQLVERRRHRPAGDGRGSLADDRDPLDRTGAETLGDGRRKRSVTDDGTQPPVHLGDPAAQRLGEAVRAIRRSP